MLPGEIARTGHTVQVSDQSVSNRTGEAIGMSDSPRRHKAAVRSAHDGHAVCSNVGKVRAVVRDGLDVLPVAISPVALDGRGVRLAIAFAAAWIGEEDHVA